jgi:hypothetical protein
VILYFYALLAMSLYSAFGFRSINEANHLKFLHKVRDHKMKVRFDFRTYHFFCSGIVLITLAGRQGLISDITTFSVLELS